MHEQRELCNPETVPFAKVEPGRRAVNVVSNAVFVSSPQQEAIFFVN